MKYIVHYIGEWRQNPNGVGDPIFIPGWTKTYNTLEDMELFFKHYFIEMVKEGEIVNHTGVYVYQIQK